MRTALLDGLMCLRGRVGPPAVREQLTAEARRWMMSTARTWPFSFESACAVLGINAFYLRKVFLGPLAASTGAPPDDTAAFEELLRKLSALRRRES